MNAGEVVLAKRILTMAALNAMMGEGEEATMMLLFSWCALTRERTVQRPHFTRIRRPRISDN